MGFRRFDRLPILEWARWWDKTIERWHGEGLPADCTDRYDICRHFGLGDYRQSWFRPIHGDAPEPESHGAGILSDEADYERLHHHFFQIHDDWPVDPALWAQWAGDQQRGECVLWFSMDGFFWLPRTLLGIERHLYAFYDQAPLIHRINRENAEWMLRVIDRVCEFCAPDFMTFA
jgi:hypothetical protein